MTNAEPLAGRWGVRREARSTRSGLCLRRRPFLSYHLTVLLAASLYLRLPVIQARISFARPYDSSENGISCLFLSRIEAIPQRFCAWKES